MQSKIRQWLYLTVFFCYCHWAQSSVVSECPHPEDSYPCYCEEDDGQTTMHCNHLTESKQFTKALSHLKDYKLDALNIWMYDVEKIKSDAFKGPAIKEVVFSWSTALIEFPQFAGLEASLNKITFMSCFDEDDFVNSWSFEHLTNLKEVYFEKNDIKTLKNDWLISSGPSLRTLTFDNCKIEELEDKVFAKMAKLTTIFLMDNKITKLSRSMFPRPAESLRSISMSDNKISSLPSDIFEDMPNLLTVEFERNNIRTLSESTWGSKIEDLNRVFLEDNPIVCDGSLKWISKKSLPKTFVGTCSEPSNLKDKSLRLLTAADFN